MLDNLDFMKTQVITQGHNPLLFTTPTPPNKLFAEEGPQGRAELKYYVQFAERIRKHYKPDEQL